MGIHRYFKIVSLDDWKTPYIYEKETGCSFGDLKMSMVNRYRLGYLRRRTDGPYFLRRCMNYDLIAANSNIRVC